MSNRKIVSHYVQPFMHFGVRLGESLWVDGVPYFTAASIAEWLEFKRGHEGVNHLVKRNPYILKHSKIIKVIIEEKFETLSAQIEHSMSRKISKTRNNKEKTGRRRVIGMRFYSPIGLHLIAMESNTVKAREYKESVATLVWELFRGRFQQISPEELQANRILEEMTNAPCFERKKWLKKYMHLRKVSRGTAFRHWRLYRQGENPDDKKYMGCTVDKLSETHKLRIRSMLMSNPAPSMKYIWRVLGKPVSYTTIKRYVRSVFQEQVADYRLFQEGINYGGKELR